VRYLVDSDWLIDAAIGRPRTQRTLNHLSDEGLASLRDFLSDFAILPLTDPIAERFARMRASLRQQGQLIPNLDLLIAATAIEEGLTLITRNVRHFARIPGLELCQPR
jgi:predicted nucleic acid-binding protein